MGVTMRFRSETETYILISLLINLYGLIEI